MSTRDISCNCLSLIYGLKLFAESLQTEYFKVSVLVEIQSRVHLRRTLLLARVGLKDSSALLAFLKTYSTQCTLPAFKW